MQVESKKTNAIERWYGCYGGRGDLFTAESNRHPAKMAVPLCYRIFEHGRQRGYWKPGDVILDPMAGIFTTGIVGATLGYSVIGVELERHFIELAGGNIALLAKKLPDAPLPLLLQGDARDLTNVLRASCSGVLTSPPYGASKLSDGSGVSWKVRQVVREKGMDAAVKFYREEIMGKLPKHGRWTDDNIRKHIELAMLLDEQGNYADGAVGSPPDQELTGQGRFRSRFEPNRPDACSNPREGYSGAVTSPPFADTHVGNPGEQELAAQGRAHEIGTASTGHGGRGRHGYQVGNPGEQELAAQGRAHEIGTASTGHGGRGRHGYQYSHDEYAQIGNLRDPKGDIDAVLSSPPYSETDTNTFCNAKPRVEV